MWYRGEPAAVQRCIERAGICSREGPAVGMRLGPGDGGVNVGLQVDDRTLAAAIGEILMIRPIDSDRA